jgi:hypothetical protein
MCVGLFHGFSIDGKTGECSASRSVLELVSFDGLEHIGLADSNIDCNPLIAVQMPPNGTSVTITNPLVLYRSLLATQKIRPDPAQHRLGTHDVYHFHTAKTKCRN